MFLEIDYDPRQGNVADKDAYMHFSPSPPLDFWVQSFWQLNVPPGNYSYHSVPDNCVDWIINMNCFEDNFIVSPFLSAIEFELTGPVSYFGIRFRLLGHQGLITAPLGEWGAEDEVVRATDLLSDSLLCAVFESVKKTANFNHRCHTLSVLLLSVVKRFGIDSRLVRYIRYCHKNTTSSINLSDRQCSAFGVSARQLRRLTQLYLGMPPKDFARVLRFQQTLKSMSPGMSKAIWIDLYYDQSHYIREFKRLSGFTPTQFKNMSVLYNHPSST